MSNKVQGKVKRVNSIQRKSKKDGKIHLAWSFELIETGSNELDGWYQSAGLNNKPDVKEGDVVGFTFESDSFGRKVDVNQIEVVPQVAREVPVSIKSYAQVSNNGAGNKDRYNEGMAKGNARNAAIALLPYLTEQGYLPTIEGLTGKAKKDGLAYTIALIGLLTKEFIIQAENMDVSKLMKEYNDAAKTTREEFDESEDATDGV